MLVITILVIIVLAGAVVLTVSQNNPLDKANESVFKSDLKNFQSELTLYVVEEVGKGSNIKEINVEGENDNWKEYIPSIEGKIEYKKILQIVEGKLYIKGDSTADEIKWAEEVGIEVKDKIEVPDTIGPIIADVVASNIQPTSMNVTIIATDNKSGVRGYKLSKDDGVTYTEEQAGNTFSVTGLTASKSYNIKVQVIDNVGNMTTSNTYAFVTVPPYDNPYIPSGFTHTEGTWNDGFVIKDTTLGNEFVWIPVKNIADLKQTNFNTGHEPGTEVIPDIIKNSVSNKGGYYVGRYEQGKGNVNKKSIEVWNNINYPDTLINVNNMYNTNELGSTLMYGSIFDTTCTWLQSTGINLIDSGSWGNYKNSIAPANVSGFGIVQKTGYSEYWKKNNIYDLGGNVWEWGQEFRSSGVPMHRGGGYRHAIDVSVTFRSTNGTESYTNTDLGFRPLLYSK